MSGTILENLSGRKLSILVASLLLCQVLCFLLGGLYAPLPAGHVTVLGSLCREDHARQNDTEFLLYSRGAGACIPVTREEVERDSMKMANESESVWTLNG